MMKRISVLFILLFTFQFFAHAQGAEELKPLRTTWGAAIGTLISANYFDLIGTDYYIVNNLLESDMEIMLYTTPGNIYLILEKDNYTALNEGQPNAKYFDMIYVLDGGDVSYTSYPQSYNFRVEKRGEEIYITFNQESGGTQKIRLHYSDGSIVRM